MGRKFVIMEVVEDVQRGIDRKGRITCYPVNDVGFTEHMTLRPSRIIDGDRLRYGKCKEGEKYFTTSHGWVAASCDHELASTSDGELTTDFRFLILDPIKPEQPQDYESWVKSAPSCVTENIKKWLLMQPKE